MTTIVPNEKASSNGSAKSQDVRTGNILAARAVADAVRTSLGPKGMDKMIQQQNGEVLITNDGATIVKQMEVIHPAAKMMVELSHAQDVEAGDGTTTVVVMAGALLQASQQLLAKGIHPTVVSESLKKAARKSEEVLKGMATEVNIGDREQLIKSASTSLNSKVVSQYSSLLAPLAVDACLKVLQPGSFNLDLNNIKIVKKLGGTIDDTRLVEGLVFTQKAAKSAGGPTRVEKAKIALIQFCLSAPKSNMENQVIVSDFRAMDRAIRQEKEYIANLVRQIKKSGCNVLLVQKSILRDAVNDLSLAFLAAAKILLVKDIERDDIDFIAKTVGATPIASIEGFAAEKLGSAELVEELSTADGKLVQVTGVPNPGRTVTVLCRGSNKLVLDEADRSIHDALCVIRSLVKERYLLAGGGAPEIEISLQLGAYAKTLAGNEQFCIRAFAESLEIIPYTLAENAGLNPIAIVTELRNKHAEGNKTAGINVRKGTISNILEEDVIQPLLVTLSAIKLSSEAVAMLLKIDDIVACR